MPLCLQSSKQPLQPQPELKRKDCVLRHPEVKPDENSQIVGWQVGWAGERGPKHDAFKDSRTIG